MDQELIASQEFKKRLAQLCLSGPSNELPGKQRDRQIVLKSIALHLSGDQSYSEREINAVLLQWVDEVGHSLEVDHAALRRTLIDEKYLERSDDGKSYRLALLGGRGWFTPEGDAIQTVEVIQEAILEAAAKREQYRNRPRL